MFLSREGSKRSVPLLLLMVSVDQSAILSITQWYIVLPVILVVGWVLTYLIYGKAKTVPGF